MSWEKTAIEMFAVLGVMLALSTAWLWSTRRQRIGISHGAVAIVARIAVDSRRSIVLIKIADEIIVTGVSDAGFQRLGALPFAAEPPMS